MLTIFEVKQRKPGFYKSKTYLSTLQEFFLTSLDVLGFATPSAEDWCLNWEILRFNKLKLIKRQPLKKYLKGTAVAEGKTPWLAAWVGVDGVQMDRGILFWLASRQESDSSNCGRNGPLQSGNGSFSNLFWGVFGLARLASSDHVGLEESTLQEYVVIIECLVDGSQDGLGHFLCSIQVVITVGKHLNETTIIIKLTI